MRLIKMKKQSFRKQPKRAMDELDKVLEKNLPVGIQSGVFHLTYFPPAYRFHFNAHNLAIYGKEDNTYLISDPVMEYPTTLTYDELKKDFREPVKTLLGLKYSRERQEEVELLTEIYSLEEKKSGG